MLLYNPNEDSTALLAAGNLRTSNTARLRNGLAAMRAGTRNAHIGFVNDSTTREGMVSFGGSFDTQLAYPNYLATQLSKNLIPARADNILGGNGQSSLSTFISDFENRVSFTGSTVLEGVLDGFGGRFFKIVAGSITFDFTAAEEFDRIEIIYAYFSGGAATVNVSIDGGGTIQTFSSNGTPTQQKKITIPCTLGQHTVTVTCGATCLISGVNVYNSAIKSVQLYNFAIHGSTLGAPSGTSNAYSARVNIGILALDAIFVMSGINEWRTSVPLDSVPDGFKQRLQSAYDVYSAAGIDVIFLTPLHDNSTSGNAAQQDDYAQAVRDVAIQNNAAYVDVRQMMESYASELANGYAGDNVHLLGAGNEFLAETVRRVIEWASVNP